jgi:hypothetical protein
MPETPVTALIPLLFLVVTQLAQAGQKVDLQKALEEGRNPLGVPILDSFPGVPPLGQFNFIHGANLTQLCVGLMMVTLLSEGWIRGGLTLLAWVVFVILPVLEVDEYSSILELEEPPAKLPMSELPFYSFHAHLLAATTITLYIAILGEYVPPNPRQGLEQLSSVGPIFVGLVGLGLATYIIYLYLLKQELEMLGSPPAVGC